MIQSAVVTGVSSGIGEGIVHVLTLSGWRVFGTVRNERDAEKARGKFGGNFEALICDVTDEASVKAAADIVRERLAGENLSGLVNNAGIALSNPALVQSTEDFRKQIDVNLVGPFIVTKHFAPLLGARDDALGKPGRMVNITSVGGRIGPPFLGAYAAAKHGLEGFSESLRRELQIFGVDVILIGPGSVATPIWDKGDEASPPHLKGTIWEKPFRAFTELMTKDGRKGFAPTVIGRVVLTALSTAKPKARYAPVPGKLINWVLPTRLPSRVVDGLIAGQIGLKKNNQI
jgi:NAD(P)-dependent dehydrogenase (short-subunit alcohol dehydrogenase family)